MKFPIEHIGQIAFHQNNSSSSTLVGQGILLDNTSTMRPLPSSVVVHALSASTVRQQSMSIPKKNDHTFLQLRKGSDINRKNGY